MSAMAEEPILSRIDRLDHLLRNMEQIKVGSRSPRSTSSPSTPTSTSEYSPMSRDDKYYHCRSLDEAIMEMEHKGTLLDRVAHMEDRLLKVCKQVEEELDVEKHDKLGGDHHNKGIKQLIKSCVKSKSKQTSKSKSKSKSNAAH